MEYIRLVLDTLTGPSRCVGYRLDNADPACMPPDMMIDVRLERCPGDVVLQTTLVAARTFYGGEPSPTDPSLFSGSGGFSWRAALGQALCVRKDDILTLVVLVPLPWPALRGTLHHLPL